MQKKMNSHLVYHPGFLSAFISWPLNNPFLSSFFFFTINPHLSSVDDVISSEILISDTHQPIMTCFPSFQFTNPVTYFIATALQHHEYLQGTDSTTFFLSINNKLMSYLYFTPCSSEFLNYRYIQTV